MGLHGVYRVQLVISTALRSMRRRQYVVWEMHQNAFAAITVAMRVMYLLLYMAVTCL